MSKTIKSSSSSKTPKYFDCILGEMVNLETWKSNESHRQFEIKMNSMHYYPLAPDYVLEQRHCSAGSEDRDISNFTSSKIFESFLDSEFSLEVEDPLSYSHKSNENKVKQEYVDAFKALRCPSGKLTIEVTEKTELLLKQFTELCENIDSGYTTEQIKAHMDILHTILLSKFYVLTEVPNNVSNNASNDVPINVIKAWVKLCIWYHCVRNTIGAIRTKRTEGAKEIERARKNIVLNMKLKWLTKLITRAYSASKIGNAPNAS